MNDKKRLELAAIIAFAALCYALWTHNLILLAGSIAAVFLAGNAGVKYDKENEKNILD